MLEPPPRGADARSQPTPAEHTKLRPPTQANLAFVAHVAADSSRRATSNPVPPFRGTPAVRKSIANSISLLLFLALLAPLSSAAPNPQSASAVVEAFHQTLTEAMKKADSLGYQGRFDLIAPAVATAIDQAFMAEKSIGREWRQLTPEEQQQWIDRFSKLTVANYAGRFKGYSGEHFTLDGEEDAPHDTKLVKTTLVLPNDDDVTLNYRLHETPTGWKIIDVYMNGTVSELSLRRSEYSSTVKRDGFEKLMDAIQKKLDDFAAGNVDDMDSPVASNAPAKG